MTLLNKNDEEVSDILNFYEQQGWTVRFINDLMSHCETNGNSYHVMIYLTTPWTALDELPTHGAG